MDGGLRWVAGLRPLPTLRLLSQPFYLGKYEVTQEQWETVMGENPSKFKGPRHPVENVSWEDVQQFIGKLNREEGHTRYRLPTEAEWEYACRAGTTGDYGFFDNFFFGRLKRYAWNGGNSGGQTHPVGEKDPNAWGLYDMHGNVWEWVQDWYEGNYYRNSPATDPRGPSSGSIRVYRGGSWYFLASFCTVAFHDFYSPANRIDYLGFRVACP